MAPDRLELQGADCNALCCLSTSLAPMHEQQSTFPHCQVRPTIETGKATKQRQALTYSVLQRWFKGRGQLQGQWEGGRRPWGLRQLPWG